MAVPFLLYGIGILFAMCAACFYRMGAADWTDEKKFLIDSLEFFKSENAKLRELVRDYDKMLEVSIIGYDGPDAPLLDVVHISLRSRMHELGVEP